jgi:hypothetical protein
MRYRIVQILGLIPGCLLQIGAFAAEQQDTPPAKIIESDPPAARSNLGGYDWRDALQWQLEELELHDGRRLQGLVESESDERVDFAEVRRTTGQPTYLVKRRLPRASVSQMRMLSAPDHRTLVEKIERFRTHSLEEIRNMTGLELHRLEDRGEVVYHYAKGPWFELESRADEELTRRAIVRIEQMFHAFAEILPPRVKPTERLRIYLFATHAGYAELQHTLGLNMQNPAFYMSQNKLLAAGGDLDQLSRSLAAVSQKHAEIREKATKISAEMPTRFQAKAKELESLGYSREDIVKLITLYRGQWQRELELFKTELGIAERNNSAAFETSTSLIIQRLYHEAFHAYLENFVYPEGQASVPRWLNEGLAQVFEEGILELGTLRLDIPRNQRLADLQHDLKTLPRLPLEELLAADGATFLIAHNEAKQTAVSDRHYLYSWGLAYYLAVREPVLDSRSLDQYVSLKAAKLSPRQRFEELVRMPLDQFEQKWRTAMANWDSAKE